MKPFGLAVVLSFFLTGLLFPQIHEDKLSSTDEGKLFIRFGYDHSYRSSSAYVSKSTSKRKASATVYPAGWSDVLLAGIGYEYSNRLYFDLTYEYMNGLSYSRSEVWKTTLTDKFYTHVASEYKAHELTLRANYFVNDNRKDDPIYFVGGVTFSAQPVKNRFVDEDENETVITETSYRRFAAGPVAGVGVFWETGILSFMTELTIGSKFSIWKKEVSETSINISVSPLLRIREF